MQVIERCLGVIAGGCLAGAHASVELGAHVGGVCAHDDAARTTREKSWSEMVERAMWSKARSQS